jgi:CRISPR-associated endonuclease Csy4
LRPDPEFSPPQLMNLLFERLHLALAELQSTDIGVSFPEVDEGKRHLGNCLRLHGSALRLPAVMAQMNLRGLQDCLSVGEPRPVPEKVRYRQVRRVQAKANPERQLRRQMKRHGYASLEEARQAALDRAMKERGQNTAKPEFDLGKAAANRSRNLSEAEAQRHLDNLKTLPLPYLALKSRSTGQPFSLFLHHTPLQPQPAPGSFNAYGLGRGATVPWF